MVMCAVFSVMLCYSLGNTEGKLMCGVVRIKFCYREWGDEWEC